jgi:hypothetical protein
VDVVRLRRVRGEAWSPEMGVHGRRGEQEAAVDARLESAMHTCFARYLNDDVQRIYAFHHKI